MLTEPAIMMLNIVDSGRPLPTAWQAEGVCAEQ